MKPTNLTHARTATNALFFMCGIAFASWASRIPDVKDTLKLSDALLGTVLLSAPVGSLTALPFAGILNNKFGSRLMCLLGTAYYLVAMPLIGLSASTWQIMASLFLFGFGADTLNIAMNVQAVGVEKRLGRTIMSSFHGVFSVGFMAGFALGGLVSTNGISVLMHMALIGVLTFVIGLLAYAYLLKVDDKPEEAQPLFALPDKPLAIVSVICLCAMLGEGAMADWSVLYFKQLPNNKISFITAASTAFSVMMVVGRFLGDWITLKIGLKNTIFLNCMLYALGMVVAILFPTPWLVIIGFGLTGLGLSTIVPLCYSEAGRSKSMTTGMALAAISTIGILGFLFGPVIIGYISEFTNLKIALSLLIPLGAFAAILTKFIPDEN
jgi:MFS family permease